MISSAPTRTYRPEARAPCGVNKAPTQSKDLLAVVARGSLFDEELLEIVDLVAYCAEQPIEGSGQAREHLID